MNNAIKSDLYRYGGQTSLLRGFKFEGFRYMYSLRKVSNYRKFSILGILYRLNHRRLGYKYGFQIPVNTKIGNGFYIGHFGTLVISGGAKIGKTVMLHIM